MGGKRINPFASYRMATNDYIAKGGSGFDVLKRNTTKIITGISIRDALVEYLMQFPTCQEILARDPNGVDPLVLAFCEKYRDESTQPALLVKGSCTCADIAKADTGKCGAISPPLVKFCKNPMAYPVVIGASDNRILRKVN